MKLTKTRLQQIIREEIQKLNEGFNYEKKSLDQIGKHITSKLEKIIKQVTKENHYYDHHVDSDSSRNFVEIETGDQVEGYDFGATVRFSKPKNGDEMYFEIFDFPSDYSDIDEETASEAEMLKIFKTELKRRPAKY